MRKIRMVAKATVIPLDWGILEDFEGQSIYAMELTDRACLTNNIVWNLEKIASARNLFVEVEKNRRVYNKTLFIEGKAIASESYGLDLPRAWWGILDTVLTREGPNRVFRTPKDPRAWFREVTGL